MLTVDGLSKSFAVHARTLDRLKDALWRGPEARRAPALADVSFRVADGETLGIIGRNGAGKSTLLKLLAGVMLPDAGRIERGGRVSGLLELGIGFDPELSGRQNALLSAMLLGQPRRAAKARLPEMLAFSELGDFLDMPLKTYSSGMAVRLAFAVAYHADPACFLIDEALSVGDAHFQQKCMARIAEFKAAGGTIVFVSHDTNAVKRLCDRVLVLEQGRIDFAGAPEDAVNHYNALIAGRGDGDAAAPEADATTDPADPAAADPAADGWTGAGYGTRQAAIADVRVRAGPHAGASQAGDPQVGDWLTVDLLLRARSRLDEVTVGVVLRDAGGQDVFGLNSYHAGRPVTLGAAGAERWVRFACRLELAPGTYRIGAALHGDQDHLGVCYHWIDRLAQIAIQPPAKTGFRGLCRLPARLDTDAAEAPRIGAAAAATPASKAR